MNLNDYQKGALNTYENRGYMCLYPLLHLIYPLLGLIGEVGEFVEFIKKIIRNKNGLYNQEDREKIKNELGDILWYLAVVADKFDLSLQEIALSNLQKLESRRERGVICSEGDNR